MSLTTSSQFAAVIETGTDWRDISKKVLEKLESARTEGDSFNIGFLYVSDYLSDNLQSILSLFQSVLGIEHWTGSVAMGLCGNGTEYIDVPAISVMIGHIPQEHFCLFPSISASSGPMAAAATALSPLPASEIEFDTTGEDDDAAKPSSALESWLGRHEPMMVLVHGDPMMPRNPFESLSHIDDVTGGYIVGGLASSRAEHNYIAGAVRDNDIGGIAFSQDIPVATALMQGCKPIGGIHTITKCHEHSVLEINNKPALDVLKDDIKAMAEIKKREAEENKALSSKGGDGGEEKISLPPEETIVFRGEVHAAIPVSGSDQNDFMVRNIIQLDEDTKAIDIAQIPQVGEQILFVHRDDETVRQDLSAGLCRLHARIQKDYGEFSPKAALYISCVARAFNDFKHKPDHDQASEDSTNDNHPDYGGEMALVREIIGDVPLAGFYASGEIHAGRLYGYTGILVLFL
ncbi:MAG: FIST N-terminal domain-containing protein [Alphaproteobacteria bacterium]